MEANGAPDELMSPADGLRQELVRAVEALVFAADEPVSAADIAEVFATVTGGQPPATDEVDGAVERLNAAYERSGSALRVYAWAGGYRMATARAAAPYLNTFFKQDRRRRLSRSLMETLAILSYRQPATKPEIDFVRGVDSDYAVRKLLEIGLVDVIGRSDSIGRPLLYGTTGRFLEEFGLSSLDDLPNLREIEELLSDPAFNKEKARLLMVSGLDASQENGSAASDS